MRVPFRVEAGEVADVAESHPALTRRPSRQKPSRLGWAGCLMRAACISVFHRRTTSKACSGDDGSSCPLVTVIIFKPSTAHGSMSGLNSTGNRSSHCAPRQRGFVTFGRKYVVHDFGGAEFAFFVRKSRTIIGFGVNLCI